MGGFFQRVMEKEDINEDGEVDFQCAAFLLQGGQAQRSHNILCSLCEKFPKKVDYLLALGLLLLTQSVSQVFLCFFFVFGFWFFFFGFFLFLFFFLSFFEIFFSSTRGINF